MDRELQGIMFSINPLIKYLKEPLITDIFVDKGLVSIKRFGKGREDTNEKLSSQTVRNIIVQIAKYEGKEIDYKTYPVLEGNIPLFDARITGLMYWTNEPCLIIRKRPSFVITIDEYVKNGCLKMEDALLIKKAIKNKENILVSGGPGSGKTTFTNAVIKEMSDIEPSSSFFVVEDTNELLSLGKYTENITVPPSLTQKAIELALRSSPDRIIFGEIRNGYVLKALLDSWNTGCPGGVATIHANSAKSCIPRMKMLLNDVGAIDYPIKESISLIVHMKKDERCGVIVDQILETKNIGEE